ncbi:ABC transporter substrate-binding protein [Streptomyces sp. B1866]|uniref:ABC transporter substrate-binding protein n=1 Tax=Streptomyces sp. B1866 TaxID=3075431 RepID=UPI00288EA3C4|nr:ABC transporter substrate-binding protein [Streptomyces sp. B1866]MDT3397455.1 ABC transporter substrate-binding protein [Streptomyces sp. B1866]
MRLAANRAVVRSVIVGLVLAVAVAVGYQLISSADDGGGPIRVGTTDRVTALDPAGAYDSGSWALYSNVYQSLLTFDPGATQPRPDAARACAFQGADLTVYVCRLRPGLRFAGGRPITAEDVKYSFDRVRRINDPRGPAPLFDTLAQVRADGPDKVVFTLRTPDATFPFKIATGAGSIVDRDTYPADHLHAGDGVTGSGPYVLKSYQPDDRAELRPNRHYRGAVTDVGGPVTIRYFRESADLSGAWRRKELDVVGRGMPPSEMAALKPGQDGITIMESAGATTHSLVFNTREKSAARDVAVRRAVAAVVDRDALARDVYRRTVEPLYSVVPQGITGHTTPFYDRYPEPDRATARALLLATGQTLPVRLSLGYAHGEVAKRETEELRRQLEATGLFTVRTVEHEWGEFQSGFAKGEYDAFLVSWVADFPDPDTFVAAQMGSGSSWHNGYQDEEVDELIQDTQRQSNRAAAVGDFRTLQQIAARDVPLLPLWQRKTQVLSTDSIAGTQYLSDGTGTWRLWRLSRL